MSEAAAADPAVKETAAPVPPAPEQEPPTRRRIREQEEQSLFDYLRSLSGDGTPIKVSVIRMLPKTWEGRTIEGTLDTFEEPIAEEEIRELFGGGKYKLVIYTPNAKGSWQYATSRQIKIAGDPRLDGLVTTATRGNINEEPPSVVRDAMRMSQQMVARAEARAERATEHRPDPASQMVMDELRAVRHEMRAKDERILELATAKPDSSASEILLGKMVDGESARMAALRTQIDSEVRSRNDMHRAETDRLHQRYEDIARRGEAAHTREIDMLRQSSDNNQAVLKVSYEGQIDGFRREIAHLDRQLTVAQSEVAELRAKKDKPMIETLAEMAAVKDAFESFGGDKEEGSTVERIISGVMGSPLAEGIANRLSASGAMAAGGAIPNPQPQGEPEVPVNQPVHLPDGRVIVRRTNGQVVELRRKPKPPAPTGEDGIVVDDEDISVALQFMENALAGDADPEEFARTARNLVPSLASGPIAELLRAKGVDAFLSRVAKLSPGSPLLQQHGKNWTRKVAAVLLA
jgi:hypothetical protein